MKRYKIILRSGVLSLLIMPLLGLGNMAAAQQPDVDWVDWHTENRGDPGSVEGTVLGMNVVQNGPMPLGSVLNGGHSLWNNANVYTPAIPSGDLIAQNLSSTSRSWTITFDQPITNPRAHFNDVEAVYRCSATPVLLSSNGGGSIVGNHLVPTGKFHGTIQFNGVFSSITFVYDSGLANDRTHWHWGIRQPVTDSDGDDAFPMSNMDATVVIDECDSLVPNQVLADGSTFNDLIGVCAADATNHGEFVSCVSHLTNEWKKDGLITGKQKGATNSCGAHSSIP